MKDLTTGTVTGHLLRTTSFMLAGMVFQTLYVLVDLYWVSHLGTESVAAVGLSANLMFIVLAVTQMLGVGTTTLVSHAAGRRDRDEATLVFNQAQVLAVVIGGAFLIVGMALRTTYARTLSADDVTARLAGDYLLWFIPAMALQFGLVGMGAALRGTGLFKPGMVVQIVTVVLNMILAPFLIFGWITGRPLGVGGAALASFIAIGIGIVWLTTYFRPASSYLKFDLARWTPQLGLWGRMLKIGVPAGAEFALTAIYLFIVYSVSRPFGAAAQAGFGIGLRIIQASFLPVVALGFAVAPVAGQNFGAALGQRVRDTFRAAALMAASVMAIATLAMQFWAAGPVRLFSDDPQVVAVGVEYLRIISWTFVASGVIFVSSSMFQAIGNTLPALITSLIRLTLVAVPVLTLARRPDFALRWVWFLSVASVALQMCLNLWLLRREFETRLQFTPVPAAAKTPAV